MIYKWFKIFNLTEFTALGLVSQDISLLLDGVGQKDFLVTQGNLVSITSEGVFMPLNLNSKNPFEFDSRAVYVDADTQNVYFGYLQP